MQLDATRAGVIGGIAGPAAFIGAWAVCGAATEGYSPVHDAISRLAAVEADTRGAMTLGFIAYAAGLVAYGRMTAEEIGRPAGIAAALSGIATLGVALTPLDVSESVDTLHGIAAGTGYVAVTLTALLAVRPMLGRQERTLALAAAVAGVVAGTSLVLTTMSDANGLFQRLGLTVGDFWIMGSAVWVARRRAMRAG